MSDPNTGLADVPLDFYTRYGELDLVGRLLIRCDQHLAAGSMDAAFEDLLLLLPRAPWLEGICASRFQQVLEWRYAQEPRQERVLTLSPGEPATTETHAPHSSQAAWDLLQRVLSQPSSAVVLGGWSEELLLEGLLQQAVWNATVWLDPQAIDGHGDLPPAGSLLDGLVDERGPAPLRELRLRQAAHYLRQQGLAWVPRRQPLRPIGQAALETSQPAEWPRCLQRSTQRRLMQAQNPLPAQETSGHPGVSLALVITEGDSAEAIRASLRSLITTWAETAPNETAAPSLELVVVHPPLRPAQRSSLISAIAEVPAALQPLLQQRETPKRGGRALACNQALAACSGEHLLVIRAGATPNRETITMLLHALGADECRAAQPALRSDTGRVVGLGYGFGKPGQPGQALLHGLSWPDVLPSHSRQQAVLGSCLLLRRHELLAVGGWDPQFRDGLEDQDLCLRLIQRFGGHCLVCTEIAVRAPLEQGLEACNDDRDWNRCVFQQRWGHQLESDLAAVAAGYGYALVGLLSEPDPPLWEALGCSIGVLAPSET